MPGGGKARCNYRRTSAHYTMCAHGTVVSLVTEHYFYCVCGGREVAGGGSCHCRPCRKRLQQAPVTPHLQRARDPPSLVRCPITGNLMMAEVACGVVKQDSESLFGCQTNPLALPPTVCISGIAGSSIPAVLRATSWTQVSQPHFPHRMLNAQWCLAAKTIKSGCPMDDFPHCKRLFWLPWQLAVRHRHRCSKHPSGSDSAITEG